MMFSAYGKTKFWSQAQKIIISSGELQLLLLFFMLVISWPYCKIPRPATPVQSCCRSPNVPFRQGTGICLLWSWWYLNSTSWETLVVVTSARCKWTQRTNVQGKGKNPEKHGKDTILKIQRF